MRGVFRVGALVILLAVMAASWVQAGDEPTVSGKLAKLQLSGVGWATYRYQLGDQPDRDAYGGTKPGTDDYSSKQVLNGKDMNQFDVDRVYVTADYAHDERFSWQTQIEANNVGGKLDLWLKKAYFKVKSPMGVPGSFIQMGQIGHVMTGTVEKAWGFRSVGPVPLDRYLGVSTTWVGLGGGIALADGMIDVEAAVANEKSYRKVNESKYKSLMGRATFTPMPKAEGLAKAFHLAAFAQTNSENSPAGFTPSAADNRNLWFEVVPYLQTEKVACGVDFAQKQDKTPHLVGDESEVDTKTSQYVGAFIWADVLPKLRAFGRFDKFDPNTDVDDDGFTNVIAGVAHTHIKGVRGIVDLEFTQYEEPEGADFDSDVTLSARLEVSL